LVKYAATNRTHPTKINKKVNNPEDSPKTRPTGTGVTVGVACGVAVGRKVGVAGISLGVTERLGLGEGVIVIPKVGEGVPGMEVGVGVWEGTEVGIEVGAVVAGTTVGVEEGAVVAVGTAGVSIWARMVFGLNRKYFK